MVSRNLISASMLLAAGFGTCLGQTVLSWPAPDGEKLSEDYTVRVNGQAVPVYSCRVSAFPLNQVWPGYQRPMDQTELASFAYWEMSGPVTVEVSAKRAFQSVAVRPTSRGIKPAIKGRRNARRSRRCHAARRQRAGRYREGPHHQHHRLQRLRARTVDPAARRRPGYGGSVQRYRCARTGALARADDSRGGG